MVLRTHNNNTDSDGPERRLSHVSIKSHNSMDKYIDLKGQPSSNSLQCLHHLKSNLKKKFQHVFEGTDKAGNPTLLNEIYTELYITEGGAAEVNDEHEVRQIETASRKPDRPETTIRQEDIFKGSPGRAEPIRTVLTKGVAGIGKTVLTQKFILDWAEGKANQDIQFMFPLTFRELNVLKEKKFSLVELVHHFFTETKEAGICSFEDFQVVFIFDGLDECRLPLDFHNTEILTDVTEPTSVDVLLINLIRGNLLPSARLWITTQPAAANQIPPQCVGMVTEVRGFTDPQMEEYFRKRFRDKKQARRIISHIKTSRSLHMMCHIPVFCWITATVLEDVLKTREGGELPKTLTEMYIHFLVVPTKPKKVRFAEQEDIPICRRKVIESLGKLAFEQLQKGNLIFYESDLTECGIDIRAASVYSGVFTQVFKEERGLYQDKVFCFIHLSVQEFLAALHVHLTFTNSGVNLLEEQQTTSWWSKIFKKKPRLKYLHQTAVDKALQSPNGHLDLFLRFLLGLSLQTNQTFLQGLLTQTGSSSQTNQETVQYIKKKIRKNSSAEKSITLFHCLNELNDGSLGEDNQQSLRSGSLSTDKLSPEKVLSSRSSKLRELDLSNNNLKDSGIKSLSVGLKTPQCRLKILSRRRVESPLQLRDKLLAQVEESNYLGVLFMSHGRREREIDKWIWAVSAVMRMLHWAIMLKKELSTKGKLLSDCMIREEGCASLAAVLKSNPTHLRELDLSDNDLQDLGVTSLSVGLKTPHCRLKILRLDHGGEKRIKPGLRKYFCQLEVDTNTVHRNLKLSDSKKTMTVVDGEHPDHPHRFEYCWQLLCKNQLTGRCYWEVEWGGGIYLSLSYSTITRKGYIDDCRFGWNDKSWSLFCSDNGYHVWHNNTRTSISSSSVSNRVAVYVDCPAGTLSFYRVSSDTLIHLH
ncbi:protein NLRC3-like, partial [Archocentrus centrarchus]|uniref:protein NLRC3-like n=1 Tax=Archocentrus centrarchus TaxID=63155 RepID=UPI0011E9C4E0